MSTSNGVLSFTRSRVAFLFLLALVITVLFFWVIRGFVLALVLAAVFAAIAHPFHRRLAELLGGRTALASSLTVVLSLLLVFIPLLLFIGVLVDEAAQVAEAAGVWIAEEMQDPGRLQRQLEARPELQDLLPYQDEILDKAGTLASKTGAFVAQGFAAAASGTAAALLTLFVMLVAMFSFLIDGRELLDAILRFTPLSADDKERLMGTFVSVGRATLKGTVIIGIVQGGLAGLSFWVAGIEGALFWSVLMAVLSIVPGIGCALVWVPAVVFLALNGQTVAAVGVGLWCALVVGTIDNVLRPMLVGKDTEMPDLLVMLTTLGGLALFGAAGLLLGPIIGALYVTVWRIWGSAMDEASVAAEA